MPNRRSVVHAFYIAVVSTVLALFPSSALAGQVNLTWDLNTEPDIYAYHLYFGTQSGTYDAPGSPLLIEHPQDLITVTGLQSGLEYFFALTAIDQSNNESGPSTEISAVIPEDPNPSDTTPPTISLTAPSDGSAVSGNVIVSASASDDIGVVGVQFQLDGVDLGNEDTTSAYSTSWDTSGILSGTRSLTAIARDAAGNTATSSAVVVTIDNGGTNNSGDLQITNVQVESGENYQVIDQGFIPGATIFIDRSYTFTTIPSTQTGATFIQTANGDKNSSGISWLSFNVNEPVTVYIAHDQRINTKPSWMDSFTNTGDVIQTSDATYEVWSQPFDTGSVLLGGNRGSGGGASMYSVAVVGQGTPTADTTPPSTPAIQSAVPDSSTQATITWAAATDNVAVTGYTLYRDNNPITTTSNLTYVDTSLSSSTTYSYYVVAHDAAENDSDPSAAASVSTPAPPDTTPPSTPTIESGVADSSTQATISWAAATDNVAVTGYTLYRDNNPITTTPNLSYVDATLSPSTAYAYFVVAHDAAENDSASSSTISVTTLAPPDTTLPTVNLTAPTSGETVSGTVVVTATAADNVGVIGVQFQLDGINLGAEDTTNEYSVSWDTSSILTGTHSLTAIARDAAGNTATSTPVVVSVDNNTSLEISNIEAQSGNSYVVFDEALAAGQTVYSDRTYTFSSIPGNLTNATYLQTANGDKNSSSNDFLSFDVNQSVTVYVAHDQRIATKPSWMSGFTSTGDVIQTTDATLDVWSQDFPAGQVLLGGNRGSGGGASMYSVAIVSDGGLGGGTNTEDTTPPSTTSMTSAIANSSSQVTLSWVAATDNIGVTGYHVYRNGLMISTTSGLGYVDTGLTSSTSYSYAVQAFDGAGNVAALSSTISVTTETQEPPPNTGTAQLSWQKNPEGDLSHYMVYYGNTPGVYDSSINVGLTNSPAAPNYTITGLSTGTYYFTVRAVDTSGNTSSAAPEGTKTINN